MNWEFLFARIIVYAIQGFTTPVFYLFHNLVDHRIGILDRRYSKKPTRSLKLPCSGERRWIKIDIYEPQTVYPPSSSASSESADRKGENKQKKWPVHINFHGSGFFLKIHGSDAEICAYLANELQCIVIDADYAKAPRHPWPAATNDALDVLSWVAAQSSSPSHYEFDLSKVTVGGFSAGGTIALNVATRLGRENGGAIKGVIAWYTPTNLTREGKEKAGKKAWPVMRWLHRATRMTYVPPGIDRKDPKVSPLFADSGLFPPTTLIVGEEDKLFIDSQDLAEKLKVDGVDCVLHSVPGADHGWERFVRKDTPLWSEREKALQLTVERLKKVHET